MTELEQLTIDDLLVLVFAPDTDDDLREQIEVELQRRSYVAHDCDD